MFYDKEGKKIDEEEFSNKVREDNYKIVKQDYIDRYFISTVWLGVDHGFLSKAPVIFETMTFPVNGDIKDWGTELYQKRYCTEKEALEGHKDAVEWLNNKLKEEQV